jgi:hypothetical protein
MSVIDSSDANDVDPALATGMADCRPRSLHVDSRLWHLPHARAKKPASYLISISATLDTRILELAGPTEITELRDLEPFRTILRNAEQCGSVCSVANTSPGPFLFFHATIY